MSEGIAGAASVPTAPVKSPGARSGRQQSPGSGFADHLRKREIGAANELAGNPAAEKAGDQARDAGKHRSPVSLQPDLRSLARGRLLASQGGAAQKPSTDLEMNGAADDRKHLETPESGVMAEATHSANAKEEARERVRSRKNDPPARDLNQLHSSAGDERGANDESDHKVESSPNEGAQADVVPLNGSTSQCNFQIGPLRPSTMPESDGAAQILEQLKVPIVSAALQMDEKSLGGEVRTLHIILRPEALGEVEISLRRIGKTLSVTVETEMTGTGDMLRRDSPALAQLISSAAALDTTIAISDDPKTEAASQQGQSGGPSDRDSAGGGFSRRDGRPPFPHKDNLPSQARDVTVRQEIHAPLRLHPAGILLL